MDAEKKQWILNTNENAFILIRNEYKKIQELHMYNTKCIYRLLRLTNRFA